MGLGSVIGLSIHIFVAHLITENTADIFSKWSFMCILCLINSLPISGPLILIQEQSQLNVFHHNASVAD